MESDLAAPPENVLRRSRPFAADEVADLALAEPAAEILAEIAGLLGIAQHLDGGGAVAADEIADERRGKRRMLRGKARRVLAGAGGTDIAAGESSLGGPGGAQAAKEGRELLERVLGELSIGRDLAAEDREERRLSRVAVELQHVVAGHRR